MISCDKKQDPDPKTPSKYAYDWENHVPFVTNYGTFNLPFSNDYNSMPGEQGLVSLSEASGIAYSRSNPGKIWAHNDSGHPNNIFLIDTENGEILATYIISNAINIDWEDMEIANGPLDGVHYLYIADTGDNDEKKPNYSIYRFEEPIYDSVLHYKKTTTLSNLSVDRIRFRFPTGSHDTEAMMVDPLTKDIYLITKRDVFSMLFVIPYPQTVNEVYPIFHAGTFSFRQASAASCSFDGSRIAIKNRQEIFYWKRELNVSLLETLATTPLKLPYVGEPQGEAICFDSQFNYFTLSEELNQQTKPILFKYTTQ